MSKHISSQGLVYRPDTTQRDYELGPLKVHLFEKTLGAESINLPEHSIFLLESTVTTGDVWEGVQERQREWAQGDIIFLPAETEVHARYVSQEYSETMIRIPDGALRDVGRGDIDIESRAIRFMGLPRSHVGSIAKAVRDLAVAQAHSPGFAMLVESLTLTLMIGVLGAIIEADGLHIAASTAGLTPERRRRVLDYINANLSAAMTLADIASAAALSPFHFTRAFNREMGTSPMRYVWRQRSLLAKRMLHGRDFSLVQIAFACGFSSQSHFTTAFKATTGVTPAAFRRSVI